MSDLSKYTRASAGAAPPAEGSEDGPLEVRPLRRNLVQFLIPVGITIAFLTVLVGLAVKLGLGPLIAPVVLVVAVGLFAIGYSYWRFQRQIASLRLDAGGFSGRTRGGTPFAYRWGARDWSLFLDIHTGADREPGARIRVNTLMFLDGGLTTDSAVRFEGAARLHGAEVAERNRGTPGRMVRYLTVVGADPAAAP